VKKTNEIPSRRGFMFSALIALIFTSISMLVGCPAGTKTSVDFTGVIKIGPDNCREDRTSETAVAAPPDQTLLTCDTGVTGEVGTTVRVLFPRKAWYDMRTYGAVDAGPGK